MGARIAVLAETYAFPIIGLGKGTWGHRITLYHMSLKAHDQHEPPWYAYGWEPIAHALGLDGKPSSQQQRVSRILGDLKRLEVIRRSHFDYNGEPRPSQMTARWILDPDLWITLSTPVDKPHP